MEGREDNVGITHNDFSILHSLCSARHLIILICLCLLAYNSAYFGKNFLVTFKCLILKCG